ncbi:MAG TPA: hypothetical protein VN650_04595 [Gemmatimonadaceae bacterium]|nr:hypothetical protein [Gemmatimonadaceae bacterium]
MTDPSSAPRTIVAVAGDPGGARALAPVIERLRSRAGVAVRAIAYLHAREVWGKRHIAFEEANARASDVLDAVRTIAPDGLLVATSANGVDLERAFTAAANELGLPSVAVVDFWSNYRLRFESSSGSLELPTRIAVMDAVAEAEMVALGFPASRIVVTGQPALGELVRSLRHKSAIERNSTRGDLGLAESDRVILFASQPIAASPVEWGYSERTVIPALIDALSSIGRRRGEKLHLVIRPHPRETPFHWASPDETALTVQTSALGEGLDVALAADLVTGMTTVLLVEACLAGCVVASLQPGLRLEDPLPTNRLGASKAIYSKVVLETVIEDLLYSPATRAGALARCAALEHDQDAAANVERLILSLIDQAGNEPKRGG